MPKDDVTVRELVQRIVRTEGPKGQAVAGLNKLHKKLTRAMEIATDPDERRRINYDIQYLEGWQETPAALLADMQHRPHRRRSVQKSEPTYQWPATLDQLIAKT